MKRRVAITGIGVVAPNGIGKDNFWTAIKAGKTGISKISSFNTSKYPVDIAGEVKNFDPKSFLDEKTISRTAKFTQFALLSAKEALLDSRLLPGSYDSEKMGVAMGTAMGGLDFALDQHTVFMNSGPLAIDSFTTSIVVPSSATRAISLALGAKGRCMTFNSSCAASADAIGFCLNLIRNGELDIAIAGGVENPLHPAIFGGFCLARILTTNNGDNINVPKPFDLRRSGTVIGEGSAVLVLEELERAINRNAPIYAELTGYGSTCDSYHIVNPDPEGLQGARAVTIALSDANIRPQDISYINAHGTATVKNDLAEVQILKKAFGENIQKIPISSTKSITGHLLGASGAVEAVICVLAIKDNLIPPTINYCDPDPQCDLNLVINKFKSAELDNVLSNSFGFGGFNASLIFKKIGDKNV